jgi:large subunit ribosomal protein L13
MSTFMATAQHAAESGRWHVIDAGGQVLGRIATVAARLLQGKHKPSYTPFIDVGDFVVVVNADKVKLTGKKEQQKVYTSVSGFIGGQKRETAEKVRARRPQLLVERAVKGMIPKNSLGRSVATKLKVYAGTEHPHGAQNPQPVTLA